MRRSFFESPESTIAVGYWVTTALHFLLCLTGVVPSLCSADACGMLFLLDTAALCASSICFVVALLTKDVIGAERSLISTVAVFVPAAWHGSRFLDEALST